ncbi:alkyl hydroperoxide reductase/ thiol specific antioxidant/ Mal allergen [Russula earlei]|uniref:Alkyl hydroperoxide reductase/ thiol specific antioxidant/ Mal allergen n=1 Tax=Russula earlei TaxID=71964 RepID=A0ACC0TRV4_9AGAM|nr:alkyl hydroperoxide reductase/ thiol specific antioxidant/ Mal allergen [Russula earlei]
MKNLVFVGVFSLISTLSFSQVKKTVATAKPAVVSTGRNISITLTPYKNTWISLGSYYGKGKTLADSTFVDEKGHGVFKSKDKLTPGIYFVVSPQMSVLFDFLMDNKQQFSIVGDTAHKDQVVITGSPDNDLFKNYSQYSITKGKALSELNSAYQKATTKADSSRLRDEILKGNKELQAYRENFVKQHPTALLSVLFNAMKQPEAPAIPVINGKPDSLYPYRYVKDHFWDDTQFNDERLLRTPFFETKLDNYFKYYVVPDADTIYNEVKYILLQARTSKEMYAYLLTKFTNKYINPEFMGQDRVFLNLFENFYAKGDTTYLNAASRKMIFERAYSLMANQIGAQAPVLDLTDTTGKNVSLYNLDAKFTFVTFWDPTCGHCKEEIPRVDSIYKAKWKDLGVKVYSVIIKDDLLKELKTFLKDKRISSDWIEVYQTKEARAAEEAAGQPGYHQLYDVFKTPTFYLLDDKKRIIAKQLSLEQFDALIAAKLKK